MENQDYNLEEPKFKILGSGDKKPSLEEMQKFVGGLVEVAFDDGYTQILCNEEFLLNGSNINYMASAYHNAKVLIQQITNKSRYLKPNPLHGHIMVLQGKSRLT